MIVVHHNARCGKSRAVLALLAERGEPCVVVDYLEAGWSRARLLALFAVAGIAPREALRATESKRLAPALLDVDEDAEADRERVVAAMVDHPILVERPLVCAPGGVAICRPPERVLDLIGR